MGRRATVLSIQGGENDPTGLPEPLGLFPAPKTGKKKWLGPLGTKGRPWGPNAPWDLLIAVNRSD